MNTRTLKEKQHIKHVHLSNVELFDIKFSENFIIKKQWGLFE